MHRYVVTFVSIVEKMRLGCFGKTRPFYCMKVFMVVGKFGIINS